MRVAELRPHISRRTRHRSNPRLQKSPGYAQGMILCQSFLPRFQMLVQSDLVQIYLPKSRTQGRRQRL